MTQDRAGSAICILRSPTARGPSPATQRRTRPVDGVGAAFEEEGEFIAGSVVVAEEFFKVDEGETYLGYFFVVHFFFEVECYEGFEVEPEVDEFADGIPAAEGDTHCSGILLRRGVLRRIRGSIRLRRSPGCGGLRLLRVRRPGLRSA